MSQVFVIQNQHGHFFGKQKDWVDGRDRRLLYRTPHRDEAVNHVFEQSSKDIELRASVLECELDDNAQPQVEAGPPLLKEAEESVADTPESREENSPGA